MAEKAARARQRFEITPVPLGFDACQVRRGDGGFVGELVLPAAVGCSW